MPRVTQPLGGEAGIHIPVWVPAGTFIVIRVGPPAGLETLRRPSNVDSRLATPVSPVPPFKFGEKSDPLQMYLSDIFTTALNLSGDCGISVPAGLDAETKMPVGIQLMAPAMAEKRLLRAARAFEIACPALDGTPAV